MAKTHLTVKMQDEKTGKGIKGVSYNFSFLCFLFCPYSLGAVGKCANAHG